MSKFISKNIPVGLKGMAGYVTTFDQIVEVDSNGNILGNLADKFGTKNIGYLDCTTFETLSSASLQYAVVEKDYKIVASNDGFVIYNVRHEGIGTSSRTLTQIAVYNNTLYYRSVIIDTTGPVSPQSWITYPLNNFLTPDNVVPEQFTANVPIKIATIAGKNIYAPSEIPAADVQVVITVATANDLGGIKIGYSPTDVNTPVILDSNGNAYVTIPQAAENVRGGIKLGYTASGNNVPVKTDSNGKAYITIPNDFITQLPAATNTVIGGINIGFTETDTNKAVKLYQNKAYVTIPIGSSQQAGLLSTDNAAKLDNFVFSSQTDGDVYYETLNINGILFVIAYQSENYATRGEFLVTDINTIRTKFLTDNILKSLKKLIFIQYDTAKSLVSSSSDISTRVLEFSIGKLSYAGGSSNIYTYSGYINGNFDVTSNNTNIDIDTNKISYKQFNYIPSRNEWQTSDIIATANSSSAGLLNSAMYNKIYNSRISRSYNVVNTSSSDDALRKVLYSLLTSSNSYGEEVVLTITNAHTSGNYSGTMTLYIKTLYYNDYVSSTITLPQIMFEISGFISYTDTTLKLSATRAAATTLANYNKLLVKASLDNENETLVINSIKDLTD